MVVFTVHAIGTTASRKKQAEIASMFLIEQIGRSVTDIKFRVTSG